MIHAAAVLALTAVVVAQAATPSPLPGRTAGPTPAPTPAYNFVYRPAPTVETTPFPGPNPPQINEIDLSDATLVTPGTIHVRVLTSDAVVSMTAETFGNTFPIAKKETGLFTLDGFVPQVPDYLRNRTYNVNFTASTKDGRTASVTLPLTLK